MGARSRRRRARRARFVPWLVRVLRVVTRWVQGLPPRSAHSLGRRLGGLLSLLGVTRRAVRRNVRLACWGRPPDRVQARFERAYYRHLGLLLVELLRQPLLTARAFDPAGLAAVRALHAEGRGVIFVTGHAGLWELAGHAAGLLGIPLTSVAKLSGQADLDAFVLSLRQAAGQRVLPARGSLWALKKALDRGEAVGIVADQEARANLTFAPLFGVPAASSATPAKLHLRTRAPLAVVVCQRTGRFRYALSVLDVIRHAPTGDDERDVLAITTRIHAAFEEAIRRHPEQYLWSHRRWRRRPPGADPDGAPARAPGSRPLVL